MSSLSLKKVEKIYPGGVQAIQSMDFDIKDGEFVLYTTQDELNEKLKNDLM